MKAKRLLTLAEHLECGKRFHKKFNFNTVSWGRINRAGNYCGTAGCALGELPACFPQHFKFDSSECIQFPSLVGPAGRNCFRSAAKFFDLPNEAVWHLFYPYRQQTLRFGGCVLDQNATAEQVANHIWEFVKLNRHKGLHSGITD